MSRILSLKYNLSEEEYESFLYLIDFLQRKGFPIDFKSILQAGLNQLLSNYFKEEWSKEKKGVKNEAH